MQWGHSTTGPTSASSASNTPSPTPDVPPTTTGNAAVAQIQNSREKIPFYENQADADYLSNYGDVPDQPQPKAAEYDL